MRHRSYALLAAFAAALAAGPRPGLAGGAPAAALVTPVTSTWTIDPDSTARRGLEPGLSVRLRLVETENIVALGRDAYPTSIDMTRTRVRLWADAWFTPKVRSRLQVNYQRIDYRHCATCEDRTGEVMIENFYVEAFDIAGAPVGLRVGRQNLFYGDGLLICDGTPLDGSRTLYVNAALLTFAIPQWAVDVFAAANYEKEDLLPVIDDQHLRLVETDQCLMGVYAKTMPYMGEAMAFTLEPYFIIMRERAEDWQDRVSTLGARLVVPAGLARLRGEAAYQTGYTHPDYSAEGGQEAKNVSAFGGTAYLDAVVHKRLGLGFTIGYVYLGGDNLKTHGKFEGWNPVLGRWPQWSELYIYTLVPEAGVAYWQNIKFPLLEVEIMPLEGLVFDARVLWMYANRPDPGTCVPAGTDFDEPQSMKRGNLYAFRLSYEAGDHLAGHLLYERFEPGGYYDWLWEECGSSGKPEPADFLRFQISFGI